MKKIIVALVAALGIAGAANAQKFGHVDTQAIMQSLPEVTKANGELQATAQQLENEMKTMQEEIQRKAEEYDKQKATLNATQQQQKEEELQGLYTKLQDAYQQNQQTIQKKQEELFAPINKKVLTAIENVGKKGGYTYIVPAGSFPYIGASSTDVTNAVKAEINNIK